MTVDRRKCHMVGMRSFIANGVKDDWAGAARDIASMITEKDDQVSAQAKTIHEQQNTIDELRARIDELEQGRATLVPSNGKGQA